jgi:two-component system, NtrC family, nitrogen regulation response regulator NtrX
MSDARILVVDDEANIRELLDEILSEEGYEVTTAEDAAHARAARRGRNFDLTLLDIWMPDTDGITLLKEWADSGSLGPVVMMSGHGTVDTAVEATRLGALDFIEKPVSLSQLLRTVSKALSTRGSGTTRSPTGLLPQGLSLIGKSPAMRALRERVQAIAQHDTHVLFTGEPGSERAVAARYLAGLSKRAGQPFGVVTGAELTPESAEAILLGTADRAGVLGRAAGGMLFIDGIDRMSARAQTILYAALTGGAPIGTRIDIRVLASAPVRFERSPEFHSELQSLIGSVVVRVPPLREHAEDVPELLRLYTEAFVDEQQLPFRRFGIAAQNRLRNYPWPGNVRELKHLVKQLLMQGGDEDIRLDEVEAELIADAPDAEPLIKKDLLAMPLREAREHFERAYLQQQLQLCDGKVGQLAKRVGMERTHLYRKLRALGVDFRQTGNDD